MPTRKGGPRAAHGRRHRTANLSHSRRSPRSPARLQSEAVSFMSSAQRAKPARTLDCLRLGGHGARQRDPARRKADEAEAPDAECIHGRYCTVFVESKLEYRAWASERIDVKVERGGAGLLSPRFLHLLDSQRPWWCVDGLVHVCERSSRAAPPTYASLRRNSPFQSRPNSRPSQTVSLTGACRTWIAVGPADVDQGPCSQATRRGLQLDVQDQVHVLSRGAPELGRSRCYGASGSCARVCHILRSLTASTRPGNAGY